MRFFFQIIFAMTILSATLTASAYADDKTVYLVTYIEIMPKAIDDAATLLKHYRDASRKQIGCLRFDILHENARPERFAIFEVWSDKAALDAHAEMMTTMEFRKKLVEIQSAPYDQRANNGLYLGPIAGETGRDVIYLLTHVDLIPESNGQGLALLSTMRAASRQESGNLAYDVLQQANRPNHFTVLEEWTGIQTLEAHVAAQHTRAFRQTLLPMEGALYDERRYERLH